MPIASQGGPTTATFKLQSHLRGNPVHATLHRNAHLENLMQRAVIRALMLASVFVTSFGAALPASAFEVEVAECKEGADFIRNAALARENGMSKEQFVTRLDEDLQLIQAVPVELRWFAHSDDEARFLRDAVQDVYDAPLSPAAHGLAFAKACLVAAGHATADALSAYELPEDDAMTRTPTPQESREFWRDRT
jgi:hypothetical protein